MLGAIFKASAGAKAAAENNIVGKIFMNNKLSIGLAALNIGSTLATDYETPQERNTALAGSVFETMLMFSTKGLLAQAALGGAFTMLAAAPTLGRSLYEGVKSTQSTRTSLAVPFSQGSVANVQAHSSYSFAQREMGSAYSSMGNMAAMYASRYLTRQ